MTENSLTVKPKRKLTKKEKLRNKKNTRHFSKRDLETIEAMAQVGHTQDGIGRFLKCCGETIRNHEKSFAAWKRGRDMAKSQVSNAHFHCAKRKSSKDFPERKMFMQLQMNYGESQKAIAGDAVESNTYELDVGSMTDEELINLDTVMSKHLRKKETVGVNE